MKKYYVISIIVFLILFSLRVYSMGGISTEASTSDLDSAASLLEPLRDYLSNQTNQILPQPQAALLAGILLGQKSALPFDFKKALTNTSTIHIVVASGQNLTLLAGFLMGFKGWIGRKKTLILSLGVIVFYCFLTGLQIPILRAAVMVGLTYLAQLLNREGDSSYILFLTGGILLIFEPSWLFSISFQLSFLATIAVVIVSPILLERLKFLPEFISQDLAVSISAQLLTMPVIAYDFYQLSLVGVLVNSLILFTVPIIMLSGGIALAISFLILPLGILLSIIPNLFLTYFVYIIAFFNQRWGSLILPSTNLVLWAGYYILLLGAFLFLKRTPPKNESR